MTLAMSWIANDVGYVVADSVSTDSRGPDGRPTTTSFGEASSVGPDGHAAETSVKVVRIGERHVATLAGDGRAGLAALEALDSRVRAGETVRDALAFVQAHHAGDFVLLVVGTDGTAASIYELRGDKLAEHYEDSSIVIVGSAAANAGFKNFLTKTVEAFSKDPDLASNPTRLLTEVIAAVQAQGPRQTQMHRGVGGAIFGLHVSVDGLRPQDDVLYVFFERGPSTITIKRAVQSGWRRWMAFARAYFHESDGRWTSSTSFYATTVNPVSEGTFEAEARALLESADTPRFVAWVDVATSGLVLFEQTPYVTESIHSVVLEVDGPSFAFREQHAAILNALPTLDELKREDRRNGFWFINSEAALRRLVENGTIRRRG